MQLIYNGFQSRCSKCQLTLKPLRAPAVIELIEERLPQLRFEDIRMFPAELRQQAEAVTHDIGRELQAAARPRRR